MKSSSACDHLLVICGDQLALLSPLLAHARPQHDHVWMAEIVTVDDCTRPHKVRLAAHFSAMRHFREDVTKQGWRVHYTEFEALKARKASQTLADLLSSDVENLRPHTLKMIRPGDYNLLRDIQHVATSHGIGFEMIEDSHFFITPSEFSTWALERKRPRLEFFYRHLRQRFRVLEDREENPIGGAWNFDKQNRVPLRKDIIENIPRPKEFPPDTLTRTIISSVEKSFSSFPGTLAEFSLPVTTRQAKESLEDFIQHRFASFGVFEDAMWTDQPVLFHSRLSTVLNLKLISPRQCIQGVIDAYQQGLSPINSTEGFVRQVLGWREFVHSLYWFHMPQYRELNALRVESTPVPVFYWNGQTDMRCVFQTMKMLLMHGYIHHIHRLMVMGNFALLAGVHPLSFHRWHLSLYTDAFEWVSLPNSLGMSQFADGGIIGSKPYCASGNYIHKMSNFCRSCTYRYNESSGEHACPFTTLYWDFLHRNRIYLGRVARLRPQYKRLSDMDRHQWKGIRKRAEYVRDRIFSGQRI